MRSTPSARRALSLAAAAAALPLLLAGCGGSSGDGSSSASSPAAISSAAVTGDITVFAAASLTESFTTLGQQFEKAHPGTRVTFSFGASSALATSIVQGAPADVFASASTKNMQQVVTGGKAGSPKDFARNVMEIAVPPRNPAKVRSVNDLAGPSVKVALCQSQVPCGATAEKVFANARVTVTPVTEEADVKSVLTKVTLGEVDAGVVYVTDVRAAGDTVKGVEIPGDVNASTEYPIATIEGTRNAATAKAFMAFVLSPGGQAVLTGAGFEKP